ncbi:metallophosphoesterase family protein [Glycomyces tenuis]|uniref:metallophosphoesterase family protein n=1 Tax=Glycomyces tenuis TaxID=58116 RepID=UPI00040E758F|nr:metallophosphoesterase family protein [Glycomyces tenuis]
MPNALTRIALISDVHGNLTALRAVLDDIESRGIDRIVNLGDLIGKGPRCAEVVELARERCEAHVQGNWEASLTDPDRPAGDTVGDWWLDQLTEEQRKWLWELPFCHDFTMSGRNVRVFHASAQSVFHRVFSDRDEDEFLAMFANTEATGDGPLPDVVGYGDIHEPYLDSGVGDRVLFNVGSVGNNLYEPTPAYAIIEGVHGSAEAAPFAVQFVRVPYDVESEIAYARRTSMPAQGPWEVELRTGVYRGSQQG